MCGDACFALTLIGMERSSMQLVFHLQEYFVYDGDVVWGRDYMDFVSVSAKGDKVLDHAKLDVLKTFKVKAHSERQRTGLLAVSSSSPVAACLLLDAMAILSPSVCPMSTCCVLLDAPRRLEPLRHKPSAE